MIQKLLDRAKELCAGATKPPWQTYDGGDGHRNIVIQTKHITRDVWRIATCHHDGVVDAAFIAASRELVPILIRIVEVQREALGRVVGFCEHDQDAPGELCDCSTSMSLDASKALTSCDALAAEWGKK